VSSTVKVDLTLNGRQQLPPTIVHAKMQCVNELQRLPNVTRLLATLKPVRVLLFATSTEELTSALEFLKSKHVRAEQFVSTMSNKERESALRRFAGGAVQVCVCASSPNHSGPLPPRSGLALSLRVRLLSAFVSSWATFVF
jgi:superfamily II DNA/RNA helicase